MKTTRMAHSDLPEITQIFIFISALFRLTGMFHQRLEIRIICVHTKFDQLNGS